ncbi:glycosyltransferase family 2 protein [Chelatococcus reniformis]|uniref:Glycosyltransferase 2-like domain-containing protein n=1 Tax=Chelatococcus reniformis TaxID=1494448 RepID=A0A916UC67_9HYPH|nr:glycosyltransferase [Chelatococcus reniformis]GGC67646.1 hypothetical protein GCM10010994_27810 [Chelatococcus reniformis]
MAELSEPSGALLSASRHADMLTLGAASALNRGDAAAAFRFADRRCRVSRRATARDYLLRAEALHKLGNVEAAQADLATAIQMDPADPLVAVRLLRSPDAAARRRAAWALLRSLTATAANRLEAVETLFALGEPVVAQLCRAGAKMRGWVCWPGSAAATFQCHGVGFHAARLLERDPAHPLSQGHNACLLDVDLDFLGECKVSFRIQDRDVPYPVERELGLAPEPRFGDAEVGKSSVTALMIVVPVYEDYEATRDCLESLLRQDLGPMRHRIVVIDDASPNPAIKDLVEALAARGDIELLSNHGNRGFAASVNRALRQRSEGEDVVLVNADTLLPSTALVRLGEAAYGTPAIGTVTPWSNNGDLFSLPEKNVVNPIGGLAEVEAWDKAAAAANGTGVVDAPNGVGFCMFITAACLDRLGGLAEGYGKGYYEDVDFCLRAKALGFRNVCATGVYVGHLGSRSFNHAKRDLVVHNLTVLATRFPDYRLECAVYLELDPLRPAREAIARLVVPGGVDVLHVAGQGPGRVLLDDRIARMRADGSRVVCASEEQGTRLALTGAAGEAPQSLSFALGASDGLEELAAYLERLDPARIELSDPLSLPPPVWDILLSMGKPIDWVIADGRILAPSFRAGTEPCRIASDRRTVCDGCLDAYQAAIDVGPMAGSGRRLDQMLSLADHIIPLDRVTAAFVRRFLGAGASAKLVDTFAPADRAPRGDGRALGVVVPAASSEATRLIASLSSSFRAHGYDGQIVVFGQTLSDLAVMGLGNVFVAGRYGADDLLHAKRHFGLKALVLPYRDGLALPDTFAAGQCPPKAFFDFSFGATKVDGADLALDPRLCGERAAGEITRWFLDL